MSEVARYSHPYHRAHWDMSEITNNECQGMSVQWSRTITVHSDRDELIMFIKFLFPYHLQLINPRTLNGRLGHLKCEVIE